MFLVVIPIRPKEPLITWTGTTEEKCWDALIEKPSGSELSHTVCRDYYYMNPQHVLPVAEKKYLLDNAASILRGEFPQTAKNCCLQAVDALNLRPEVCLRCMTYELTASRSQP